jgi:hypothetical protein
MQTLGRMGLSGLEPWEKFATLGLLSARASTQQASKQSHPRTPRFGAGVELCLEQFS